MPCLENDMNKTLTGKEIRERKHFDLYANKYDQNYDYSSLFTKYKINKKVDDFIEIITRLHSNKDIKILELGCGTGEYTRLVAKRFPNLKIIGIDISSKILQVARQKCKGLKNVDFETTSAYDTKFRKGQFDVIFGYYILHHLEYKKLIPELNRILKKNGYLYFYEPNIINPAVYMIKSSKTIKKFVGDSEDEWAINPLTVEKNFRGFQVIDIKISEYITPLKMLPFNLLKKLDKVSSYLSYVPMVRYLGGSVRILLRKK